MFLCLLYKNIIPLIKTVKQNNWQLNVQLLLFSQLYASSMCYSKKQKEILEHPFHIYALFLLFASFGSFSSFSTCKIGKYGKNFHRVFARE